MKMLFIHDNKFWKCENSLYSYGHFSYDLLWKRYLKYFDNIVAGGRIEKVDDKEKIKNLVITNGKNVSFFSLPNLMSFRGLLSYRIAENRIRHEMEKADFAVIRLPSNLGYLACKIANEMHKNYAVEVVGCAWDSLWNHGSLVGKVYAPISFLLEKHFIRKAPNVIYVSRNFLQKRYPNHHFNVGCPDSNVSLSSAKILEQRINKIHKMEDKTIKIGLIASLNIAYKGHDTAILALEQVAKKHSNVKLCFLGDGSPDKWSKLAEEHGVEDKVEFCGTLPGGEPVLRWLDDIDIFVMPSLQETLGRALIEAMSRGCPAIGGAGTAVPEQLPDDCIHERKNYNQLADMINYMIEHPKYMELCASENFERAKKYSEEILNERRDHFWNTAIGKVDR